VRPCSDALPPGSDAGGFHLFVCSRMNTLTCCNVVAKSLSTGKVF
jgi:hypothetical protein